ncbi:hypothetical protein CcCBS67573_g06355 [Chytriomyces confervae]|uniref:Sugar phosphate transporter domain-containing protein n=1 Tax=Chytriomyces confervae TaxID=246404 RepID=A0A507F5M2_9FUNG|nr:hypothetical protein CcCBS67573_g06355 [Chytriomyces confervae]
MDGKKTAPLLVLVAVMLATGSMNTILNKWQDMQCVRDCDGPGRKLFEQPVWQTLTMFVGETGCLLAFLLFKNKPSASPELAPLIDEAAVNDEDDDIEDTDDVKIELEGWNLLLLWLPTLCDLLATSLMNVGLLFVSASIYQMLRGSVVLFTGTFSTLFLGRKHPPYRWFALVTVFVGVSLVGASSIFEHPSVRHFVSVNSSEPATNSTALLGVLLVVLAQSLTATQFVVEEKVLSKYKVDALKAVGLEGFFGLLTGLIVLPPVYWFYGQYQGPDNYFNIVEGFREVFFVPVIFYTGIGICFSISFFNWSGLSVTQMVSATSRSTIDTCRTVFIWIISLSLGWEGFRWMQVAGFVVLIYGTFVFNDVVALPAVLGLGNAETARADEDGDDEI